MNILKKDDLWLGLILGVSGPVAGFLIFYLIKFLPLGQPLAAYLELFKDNSFLVPKIMSLSLLVNGITFYLYTHYRKDETARGILVATLIYAIVIIVFKLK